MKTEYLFPIKRIIEELCLLEKKKKRSKMFVLCPAGIQSYSYSHHSLSVTVMLNAMAPSIVEGDTIQISYHSGLCSVWELTRIVSVQCSSFSLCTEREGKIIYICD